MVVKRKKSSNKSIFKIYRSKLKNNVTNSITYRLLLDYKLYLLLIIAAIIFLFFLPLKVWALGFLILISYITIIIDKTFNLPFKIQTGAAFAIILAAMNVDFMYIFLFFTIGILLPNVQMATFFEPVSLATYLWLILALKIIYLLPFSGIIAAFVGLIIFTIVVYFIQQMKGAASAITTWAFFKNLVLILLVFISQLASVFA